MRAIRDSYEVLHTDPDEVLDIASTFYEDLFAADPVIVEILDAREQIWLVTHNRVMDEMCYHLMAPFTVDELHDAVHSLSPSSCPGDDGLTKGFFLTHWEIMHVRLRWYGSKLVMKYPRCSLKRLSVYADAEVDNSQVMVLASIWTIFLALGLVAALGPPACALNKVCKEAVLDQFFHHSHTLTSDIGSTLNLAVFIAVGLAIGVPISTAALGALKGLWKGDLVALKGSCPSCGEEVRNLLFVNSALLSYRW
ncbi:hypothetical protein L7F22_027195 [Adiantum nelumboides]|nr:hypothetical protein [Adiantum nelumboides]